jgi:hypothetical protein
MIIELSSSSDSAYFDYYGDLMVDCDAITAFPTISFLYGDYWMEMFPEDYFIEWEGQCWACLGSNDYGGEWILGDTFLRGYYSTHDHTNKRFGFAPHAESKKKAVYEGTRPYDWMETYYAPPDEPVYPPYPYP